MRLIPASDSSLLIVFGDAIAPHTQELVLNLFQALQSKQDACIRNVHPGYVSLLVDFDPLTTTHDDLVALVESAQTTSSSGRDSGERSVEIPVCYDAEFGVDQSDVAINTGLSIDDIVRMHANATYRVAFLGFTGGFAYLSGMPQELSVPRLTTPRRTVAAGSVGIAGGQTGIYPTITPGGWRLIGRTPLRMFDPRLSQPSLLMPGDRVLFVPIGRNDFDRIIQEPV
jgi:KipI family sensor histidine kinase inhibitor